MIPAYEHHREASIDVLSVCKLFTDILSFCKILFSHGIKKIPIIMWSVQTTSIKICIFQTCLLLFEDLKIFMHNWQFKWNWGGRWYWILQHSFTNTWQKFSQLSLVWLCFVLFTPDHGLSVSVELFLWYFSRISKLGLVLLQRCKYYDVLGWIEFDMHECFR